MFNVERSDFETSNSSKNYTFALIKQGPEVSLDEIELPHVLSLEVLILWGTNVLHVAHLTPPRAFYVGEEQSQHVSCDFFIPSEKLGCVRLPLVSVEAGVPSLVIAPNATGHIDVPGQPRRTLDDVRQSASPSSLINGGRDIALPAGAKASLILGGFVFQIAAVNAGKPVKHGIATGFDKSVAAYFGFSFLAHAGLMGALAFFVPPLGLTDDEGMGSDQRYLVQQYLKSAAEREQENKRDNTNEEHADHHEGGSGTRAQGEEGSMGNPTSHATRRRYAIQGPKDNPDPHISRDEARRAAENFGMLGLLHQSLAGDPNAPTAPWGRDDVLGRDDVSARGNMWGDIGDAFGAGGLGLSGIGEGGGGRGVGIGLGNIGTIDHGAGTGSGAGFGPGNGGIGSSVGRPMGAHATKVPRVRQGALVIDNGRLPPEVIQRIVRQNYGRFRMCYEQGLTRNPNLEGRVAVRFVIGRDGTVSNASNGGSDLPDSGVVSCVISAYYGLSFPAPDGGIVRVAYPIMFAPG